MWAEFQPIYDFALERHGLPQPTVDEMEIVAVASMLGHGRTVEQTSSNASIIAQRIEANERGTAPPTFEDAPPADVTPLLNMLAGGEVTFDGA